MTTAGGHTSHHALPEGLRRLLETGEFVLFLGAGVGVEAGLPAWRQALLDIADRLEQHCPDFAQLLRSEATAERYLQAAELFYLSPVPDLDLFDGEAWLGIVPFHMTNVGLRATPAMPWISAFPELNVRTYVRVSDRPGVYFFSLDAARGLAVAAARALLNLPYYTARMAMTRCGDRMDYESVRRRNNQARFKASYEPLGPPFAPRGGSIEYFLTERYCLYHRNHRDRPYRLDIHHRPWSLQVARATITMNTMAAASHLTLEGPPALVHYARRQDVVAWAPTRVSAAVA